MTQDLDSWILNLTNYNHTNVFVLFFLQFGLIVSKLEWTNFKCCGDDHGENYVLNYKILKTGEIRYYKLYSVHMILKHKFLIQSAQFNLLKYIYASLDSVG